MRAIDAERGVSLFLELEFDIIDCFEAERIIVVTDVFERAESALA